MPAVKIATAVNMPLTIVVQPRRAKRRPNMAASRPAIPHAPFDTAAGFRMLPLAWFRMQAPIFAPA